VFVRNLVFYLGFRQEHLSTEERAAEFMRSSGRVLMVVRETDLPQLERRAGVRMQRLGAVRYFNSANVKLRMFIAPSPDEDVPRVLLVANR
jgi:hypothetical protein